MSRPPSRSRAPMSMEALLDEENREVLAALDKDHRRPSSPLPKSRAARTATPPPPRNLLDIDSSTPRRSSIAGIGVGVTSPTSTRKSGKELDPSDPSSWTSRHSSKPNSPVLTKSSPILTRHRQLSEPERPLPTIQMNDTSWEQNPQKNPPLLSAATSMARSPTEGKRPREGSSSAMAAALSGELGSLHVGLPAREQVDVVDMAARSRSPASQTRKPDTQNAGLLSPTSPPASSKTQPNTGADHQTHLEPTHTKSGSFSTLADDSEEPGRITKADLSPGEDDVVDSDEAESSDDEGEARGRSERRRESENGNTSEAKSHDESAPTSPEETKRESHSQQFVKSLLEPSVSVTGPAGERLLGSKSIMSMTARRASIASATDEEDEEAAAIRKAQALPLNESPLDTTVPGRHVQIYLRGNWAQFEAEKELGKRKTRLYFLCSDLSMEAKYAMEWVIGTMMRDGDTLLAMCAMEDENAPKTTEADKEVLTAEGNKAGKEASDIMDELTRTTTHGGGTTLPPSKQVKYNPVTEAESLTGSVDARKVSKKEMDRLKAVEALKGDFLKLVRKTSLQVRCMIEVIHCASPKHLILGAIDDLDPTLCVVGTRGRSSLKGVLLGSFSNYLVTKSSVPVMVARKKMKRPHSGPLISSSKIRLKNNLTASNFPHKRKSLTQARID